MAGKPGQLAGRPAAGLLLRVHQQVLHTQELVIGDHKVLRGHVSPFTVFDSRSPAIYLLGILLPRLALDIWMINDFTHSDAAEAGAKEAALPSEAMGAIKEGQAQVTGEVGAFPKQGRLVQVAMQPIVDDGMEVLEAAPMEGVD